ncbi:MAG: hypothetical protein UW69_C0090G0003 [Microgenomates group bacterium GW2011_GWA2_44_7]|nr:MAG: hypothetical protein UW69_C0090G0003 [Microgenomates group bacterium GW2011_GWA2_44_7]KKT77431.1 MAG: hypothetical protein UW73_C0020G0003 [Microgenomates group bacterium GW2011_GWB1_44_8]
MNKSEDRILVFGHGQMAGFIPEFFGDVIISRADITKPNEVESEIEEIKPTVAINTAAKTSIDWCELNKSESFAVNTLGPFNIWQACQKRSIFLCHFSSGCIFYSATYDQIYTEQSVPNPRCYYSWTKVWAENLLGKSPQLLVLRPRMVISSKVDRRNTLGKWLVYTHFISDQNTLTVIEDMMPVVKDLIARRISGTFNIANQGTVSPLEVAQVIKGEINPSLKIYETTLDEVNKNLVAKRCTTILSSEALRTLGYTLPPARESIQGVIRTFKQNLIKAGGLKSMDIVRKETLEKYTITQKKATTYTGEN